MALQESGEMYLETILVLSKEINLVRSIDVADHLKVSKPSVSRAVSKLKEDKYIIVDDNGYIALTEKGREVAEKIYERHIVITEILVRLGVRRSVAAEDACKIEHVISDESFQIIKEHVKSAN